MALQGFWGLQLTPGKSYSQIASSTFCITMAAVSDSKVNKPTRSSVCIVVDDMEYVLCTLVPGQIDQQELNLTIVEGEEVSFTVKGKSTIHLSGNYVGSQEDEDMEGELPANITREELLSLLSQQGNLDGGIEESESDEDISNESVASDESEDMDIDVPQRERRIRFADEVEQEQQEEEEKKKKEKKTAQPKKKEEQPKEADQKEPSNVPSNKQNQQTKRKAPADDDEATPVKKAKAEQEKPKKKSEKVVTHLPSGITIEETKVGQGVSVKKGNKIGVRYIGRVKGGKIFDKNISGKPFFFALGRQEVIKGWDEGITGMKLGGERKLTIPPALAYGKRGSPPLIPPNATLVFEVKLVSLN
ncbi:hypothetical protein O0I10_007510 [Lichtheimia ornata]|uniref:FK506-binding protein n=1 Tax=Lichtheimia ornata TaxID=688661 RepID=A0AAD7V098_9FUNG|nr:uncharacterized protein O0I10_007510 [Lichtheimia ornata]KAJ8656913.1 hypothetical protein O0I10_007510 [Lichtheimia ornata]